MHGTLVVAEIVVVFYRVGNKRNLDSERGYFDTCAIIQTEKKEHNHALEEVIFFFFFLGQGSKVLVIVSGRAVMSPPLYSTFLVSVVDRVTWKCKMRVIPVFSLQE